MANLSILTNFNIIMFKTFHFYFLRVINFLKYEKFEIIYH